MLSSSEWGFPLEPIGVHLSWRSRRDTSGDDPDGDYHQRPLESEINKELKRNHRMTVKGIFIILSY